MAKDVLDQGKKVAKKAVDLVKEYGSKHETWNKVMKVSGIWMIVFAFVAIGVQGIGFLWNASRKPGPTNICTNGMKMAIVCGGPEDLRLGFNIVIWVLTIFHGALNIIVSWKDTPTLHFIGAIGATILLVVRVMIEMTKLAMLGVLAFKPGAGQEGIAFLIVTVLFAVTLFTAATVFFVLINWLAWYTLKAKMNFELKDFKIWDKKLNKETILKGIDIVKFYGTKHETWNWAVKISGVFMIVFALVAGGVQMLGFIWNANRKAPANNLCTSSMGMAIVCGAPENARLFLNWVFWGLVFIHGVLNLIVTRKDTEKMHLVAAIVATILMGCRGFLEFIKFGLLIYNVFVPSKGQEGLFFCVLLICVAIFTFFCAGVFFTFQNWAAWYSQKMAREMGDANHGSKSDGGKAKK